MANTGLKETLEKALEVFNKQCRDNYMGEENVKIKLVLPILEKLEWNKNDIDFEHSVDKGSNRVDCCLEKGGKQFFIEVKAYKKDKTDKEKIKDINQLRRYCCHNDNVHYGVLTDGINWELYGPFDINESYKLDKKEIDLKKQKEIKYLKYLYFENKDNLIGDGRFVLEKVCSVVSRKELIDVIYNRVKNEICAKYQNVNISDETLKAYAECKYEGRIFDLNGFEDDKIIKDCLDETYHDIVKDWEEHSIVGFLSEWLKYKAMARGLDVSDKICWEYAKIIKPPKDYKLKSNEQIAVEVFKIFKEAIKETFKSDDITIDGEAIKVCHACEKKIISEFVCAFLKKFGWKKEYINQEVDKGSLYLSLKYENEKVLLIQVKSLNKSNRSPLESTKEADNFEKKCIDGNYRYGVVTNGIQWQFHELFDKEDYILKANLSENINGVSDFFSMISFDKIDNLNNMVGRSKILDSILDKEINHDLKNEVKEVSNVKDEKIIAALATRLKYKVLAMNSNIDVPEEYLENYIRWYGTKNTEKEDENTNESGNFEVTFPGCKPINRKEAKATYVEVIKKIINEKGLDRVVKYKGRGGRELVYKGCIRDVYDEPYNEEYYIACHIGDDYKEQCLKGISDFYDLKLKIERF